MAKGSSKLPSWLEVAPAPIIYPQKPSSSPRLETIAEDDAEEEYVIFFDQLACSSGSIEKEVIVLQQSNASGRTAMAKGTGCLSSWVEVAPAVLISQPKTSISPALDTIKEEESEELDQDLQEF